MSRPQDFTADDHRASDAGRKGALIRAVETKRQFLGRVALQYPGTAPEALEVVYEHAYKSGHQAKSRQHGRRS